MSGTKEGRAQTPSTVEAIRMASASILATSTGRGFPLGSAIGSGRVMEENSELVAMNVASLIFAIRDPLMNNEGLDLLALEWNLDHPPGSRVLPEQLIVAGGFAQGVGSHVCVLSWERGVIDPFKIDDHMKTLSKKISDIEAAVIHNNLPYEKEGLMVLRRFNDRLNSVIFVEMMDRRFQGSWDSLQIKPDHVDNQLQIKMNIKEDFTSRPPGTKVVSRKEIDFLKPAADESALIEHFKHRLLTPAAVEALTVTIPETGRAILSEINTHAYSSEEIASAGIAVKYLREYAGTDSVALTEIDEIVTKSEEYSKLLEDAVAVFEEIVEHHISSGKTLTMANHKNELFNLISSRSSDLTSIKEKIVTSLVEEMTLSVSRELPGGGEVRAWQLKSMMRYFVAYAKRVVQYFSPELGEYLVVAGARKVLVAAFNEFKQELTGESVDAIDRLLTNKFGAELIAQLNAIFDRKAFEGSKETRVDKLTSEAATEMVNAFKEIDVWSLVKFADLAETARSDIAQEPSEPTPVSDAISEDSQSGIADLLLSYELLATETIPDVAQTVLSKSILERTIENATSGSSLSDGLLAAVNEIPDKAPEWTSLAHEWIAEFWNQLDLNLPLSSQLTAFAKHVHEKATKASGPRIVVDRVVEEARHLEEKFEEKVNEWREECNRIEQENAEIEAHNKRRHSAIEETTAQFETEQEVYSRELRAYEESKEDPESTLVQPSPPEPIEPRLERVKHDYPLKELLSPPSKPEPSDELLRYRDFKNLLVEKLQAMSERQEALESAFSERLTRLASEGADTSGDVRIDITDSFLDHIMDSVIRGMGRLLPRSTRAYLRNPEDPGLVYLVTYEQQGDELIVTVGDTFLRGDA
ncbi:MAG: hypothetical protein JSW61_09500 [Candidatus Thorarchaeota archaeon]|nr:MAG: hypothetical protein JSW61_09500 [Candidatus Thorarchaeota archaeon]